MWPEAVGADLGVRHLIANGVRDRRVRLYNDNTAVKSGIRHGRVRNEAANHCLERLFWFASDRNITSFLLASLLPITPPTVPSEAFLLPSLGFPFYLSPLSSPQSSPASGDRTTAIAAALLTAEYRSSSSRRSVLSSPTPPSTRRASSSTAALNRRQFRPRPAPVPSSLAALAASRQLSTGGLPAVGSGAAVRGSRDERLARVMEMAFAPSTRIGYAYGTGLSHFLSWCEDRGVDEELRCPAPEELLTRFVAAQAGFYSGDYIAKMISAVGSWHKMFDVPWCFCSRLQSLSCPARRHCHDARIFRTSAAGPLHAGVPTGHQTTLRSSRRKGSDGVVRVLGIGANSRGHSADPEDLRPRRSHQSRGMGAAPSLSRFHGSWHPAPSMDQDDTICGRGGCSLGPRRRSLPGVSSVRPSHNFGASGLFGAFRVLPGQQAGSAVSLRLSFSTSQSSRGSSVARPTRALFPNWGVCKTSFAGGSH
ncbi:hypothetical protein A4X03_0g7254 [Tilletia caries]|uniref:Uncharacterized protein n=1 Tax=Tilletia caries TaxID=13290 RepID=A0A8T8SRB8_9BASI|nr:hypothetical protein A4X03_0g7254 [Tilletia caries]